MRLHLPNSILLFIIGILLLGAALLLMTRGRTQGNVALLDAQPVNALTSGAHASMDSALFAWSPGWQITREGATPPEPANAMTQPSGWVEFEFQGAELALALDTGDYWGYLYVTVDGAPANLLPDSRWHHPAPALVAGYRPLYEPERDDRESPFYLPVHRAGNANTMHTARVEVWRSWGETPLRGVLVDPPDSGVSVNTGWLRVLLLVIGVWFLLPLALLGAAWATTRLRQIFTRWGLASWTQWLWTPRAQVGALAVGGAGFLLALAGVGLDAWWLCAPGVALLGLASLARPALWYGALFFALPFYYRFALPLLPGRSINLVDAGAWLGLMAAAFHALLVIASGRPERIPLRRGLLVLLAVIASWALVATTAAPHPDISLREWRTVFLAGVAIAAGLMLTLRYARNLHSDVTLIVGGWLTGATLFAALGLLLYPNPEVIIPAEGVQRLRGFYGSPNNLALYLGRTLAVTLALLLFARWGRRQVALLVTLMVAALIQLAAFVLTFSKGGLFLALPAMGVALWGAGYYMLRRQGRSTRILWALVAVAALTVVALLPFMGTERFARIVDLGSGTGFLRVNLWRAALQMALDHPLLGVGPDGFLYAYRSQYIFPQAWMEPNLNHPHNWLLDWWTRLGIPGVLLGVAFWGLLLWNVLQNLLGNIRGDGSTAWGALQVGILAATVGALTHGLIDLSYALPDLMAVWAFFAVLVSVGERQAVTSNPQLN